MSDSSATCGLPPNTTLMLRSVNLNVAETLLDAEYPIHGLPDPSNGDYRRLVDRGVLVRVRRCRGRHDGCPHNPSECDATVYQLSEQGRELLEDSTEREVLPCSHAPFRNLVGEAGYSCTDDNCDARYTREEIEAVMDR